MNLKKRSTGETEQIGEQDGKKRCTKCNKIKRISAFSRATRHRDDYAKVCRQCRNEARNKRRELYNRKVDALKEGTACLKCGETNPKFLDWHHIDPKTKIATVAMMKSKQYAFARVKKKKKKCIVLCANHHRELHRSKLTLNDYLKEPKC